MLQTDLKFSNSMVKDQQDEVHNLDRHPAVVRVRKGALGCKQTHLGV